MAHGDADPSGSAIEELEIRASRILSRVRGKMTRPLIVEFSGSPEAGKSTTIEIVRHFFNRNDFRTLAPSEAPSKRTPSALRGDLVAFNVWSASHALSEVLVAANNPNPEHLVILDRGIFDGLCWLWALHSLDRLSKQEFEAMSTFFLLDRWTDLVRLVFLFTCEPDVAIRREREGKLSFKPGTAMNNEMLEALRAAYAEMEARFAREFTRFFTYDTSKDPSFRRLAYEIVIKILEEFEQIRLP